MNLNTFIRELQGEVNSAIAEKWLSVSDFSSHKSSRHSELQSKMIGLIAYTLQQKLGYYVQHEPRPWGQFKPDIVAYKKLSSGKFACEALVEYESPNSYLVTRGCHIGKDLEHYFDFHSKGDTNWDKYLVGHTPKVWLIITSLPDSPISPIDIKDWNWIPRNWTAKEKISFKNNPREFMYEKYRLRLLQMNLKKS